MKTFHGLSYLLALAIVFFGVGSRTSVLAEEKYPERRDNKLFDQSFGLGLSDDDCITTILPWAFQEYFGPWRRLASLTKDQGSTIKTDNDHFQVNLDVQHFSPDEVLVKTVDRFVVVEAKHEEKKDEHGYVARQFVRRYELPAGSEPEDVVSQLSSDGILMVSAPRKMVIGKGERIVPITQTGRVCVGHKEPKETNEDQPDSCLSVKCEKK